jgi:hypothetical protein
MGRSRKKSPQGHRDGREPWLQWRSLPGKRSAEESEAQYAAFQFYCSLGPAKRSLRRVAEQVGKSESWIESWSVRFHWRQRVDAWDRQQGRRLAAEFEEEQRQAFLIEAQQSATAGDDREEQLLRRIGQFQNDLIAQVKVMLDLPIVTVKIKDGIKTVALERWNMSTPRGLLLEAYNLSGRAIRGDIMECYAVETGARSAPADADSHGESDTPARSRARNAGSDPPWYPQGPRQGKGGATETGLNYDAFRRYYTTPVDRRSLRQIALEVGKHPKLVQRRSSIFSWAQRTEAWDRHRGEMQREIWEAIAQEEAQIRAERHERRREELYQISEKMEAMANMMLQFPLERVTTKDRDGNVVTIEPPRWSFLMGARMDRSAFDLAGMAIRNSDAPLPTSVASDVSLDAAPWSRLAPGQGKDGANETALNYRAFTIYYLMAVDERSLTKVAERLGKSEKLMEQWSRSFDWWERTAAWDGHRQHQQQEAAANESREKWEQRRIDRRERAYQNSQKLEQKAAAICASPITRVTTQEIDGCTVTTVMPNNWSVIDAVRLGVLEYEESMRAIRNDDGMTTKPEQVDTFRYLNMTTAKARKLGGG